MILRKSAEKQSNPLKSNAVKRGKAILRKSRGKARKSNSFVSVGSAEKRGDIKKKQKSAQARPLMRALARSKGCASLGVYDAKWT